jgi:hypothetical protein
MINIFIDEVLSKGADAILPNNLDDRWLVLMTDAAISFLRDTSGENTKTPKKEDGNDDSLSDDQSLLMLAAVMEIIQYQMEYPADFEAQKIPEEKFFSNMSCYAISVALEFINRQQGIFTSPPSLDNIFDEERIFEIEETDPVITKLLNDLVFRDDNEEDGDSES